MKLSFLAVICILLLGLLLLPLGCTQTLTQPKLDGSVPIVRVRILENLNQATISASQPPIVTVSQNPARRRINMSSGAPVSITYTGGSWRLGDIALGGGELTLVPAYDGTLQVNGAAYHGQYRFVPTGANQFDVVNDVDVDDYLKSVVSKELYARWHEQTYRAQAIVARTYALYEARTAPAGRHFDLYPDERSQVYGGIDAETDKSRQAVVETAGVVAAAGPNGNQRIFKAYFSSSCGGISQSATDAFGDRPNPVFHEQSDQGLCSASPRYNWGPIVLSKAEVTRRVKLWGKTKGNPVQSMNQLARIDIDTNSLGRPVRFYLSDASGTRFMLRSEEMRNALNTDGGNDKTAYFFSAFFKVVNDTNTIHFVEGHGHGHGVGLCQWAAQRRAELGMRHEDIVLSAYPGASLVRAY